MRYLITGSDEPFYTSVFEIDNHYLKGMVVYDLVGDVFLDNEEGIWKNIVFDHH